MLAGVEVNQSWWLSMGLTINRQRMCWFNPLRVKFLGSSKGEDPPSNTSFSGPFGAYQNMGLKILSNAKIKRPIDCSHQNSEHSLMMAGGKLPLIH